MSTIDLLSQVRRLGIRLWLDDGQLCYDAPKGALTAQLSQELVQRKREIVDLMQASTASGKGRPQIQPADRNAPLPLSYAQQHLWILDRMEGSSLAYNMSFAIRLLGKLDSGAMRAAFADLFERHEALRTTFAEADGRAYQVIEPSLRANLALVDLQALPKAGAHREAQRLAAQDTQRPFDLSAGPLMRGSLVQIGEQLSVLMVTMHHIISDAWSLSILFRDLSEIYAARLRGKEACLAPLPLQYADYSLWQRQNAGGEEEERQLDFWKKRLDGLPPLLELPTDRPRPRWQTYRGAQVFFDLPDSLREGLKSLTRNESTSLFVVLLAGFQLLLARCSGKLDIAVGSPVANRSHPDLENVVGFFVNNLILRTRIKKAESFRRLLGRVARETLQAYENQGLPFERLLEAIQPERSLSHAPLAQVRFIMLNTPQAQLSLPGLRLESLSQDSGTTKFDLLVTLTDWDKKLSGRIQYSTDLFDRFSIECLIKHYRVLLQAALSSPDQPVWALPLLTAAERESIVHGWNQSRSRYRKHLCIHQVFEEQVQDCPERIALCEGDSRYSFGAVNAAANHLAWRLIRQGLCGEEPLGVSLPRCAEMVAAILAAMKAGGNYLPIDPAFPESRVQSIVSDSNLRVVLTRNGDRRFARPVHCLFPEPSASEDPNPRKAIDSRQLAYTIYTSGSSGRPKGVGISHRSLHNYLHGVHRRLLLSESAVLTALSTMAADLGHTALFGALCSGRTYRIVPEALSLEAETLADMLEESPVDCLKIVPHHLAALLNATRPERLLPRECLVLGGDVLAPRLAGRIRELKVGCRIINHYGPTEATVGILTHECGPEEPLPEGRSIPVGRPLDNSVARVLNEQLEPQPMGVPGELFLGGDSLARGYLGQPGLTAASFLPDPHSQTPGARLYRSGDRVRLLAREGSPGPVEFLGRLDSQVKIRGFRIEPSEVDQALKQSEAIQDAAVLVRLDSRRERHLVAYAVCRPGEGVSEHALQELCQQLLPQYMQPEAIVFLEALPLTSNGKIDREALPDPDFSSRRDQGREAPKSPLESKLAEIWQDVLEVEEVGVQDNFFKLGGHSLLATLVLARILETFRVSLPVKALFENATIAELAPLLERMLPEGRPQADEPPLAAREGDQPPPLSFAQQRLWYLYCLDGPNSAFNIPAAFYLQGRLDVEALRWSLNQILRRHEVLRTTFRDSEGAPVQVIHPEHVLELPVAPLETQGEAEAHALVVREAEQEAQRPFDLEALPLLRARLLRLAPQRHALLVTVHHTVFDGWSIAIFCDELVELYASRLEGRPPSLPGLTVQYGDFARWQRQQLSQEKAAGQLHYWKERLTDLDPVLPLPSDRPRPAVQSYRGRAFHFEVPATVLQRLVSLGEREEASLFMTLMAAFQVLLARLSGQKDIAVGFPSGNRPRRNLEPLIGFFINTLVLRSELDWAKPFCALLSQVREGVLEAFARQDVPFEQVVEALQCPPALSHAPLTQTRFMLRNAPAPVRRLPGLKLQSVEIESGVSRYDLLASFTEWKGGLRGYLQYRTDLFDDATAQRWSIHLRTLLAAVGEGPLRPLGALPLMTEAQLQEVVERHNHSRADFPDELCIHQLFEGWAARRPHAPALTCEGFAVSYGELNARANRLARRLEGLGLKPGATTAICMERSPAMLSAMLAVLKAGGAFVPIDPSIPAKRCREMTADAEAVFVLAESSMSLSALEGIENVLCIDRLEETSGPPDGSDLQRLIDARSPAYVIYTSGSSGRPKGVAVSHRALHNYLLGISERLALSGDAQLMALATVGADLAHTATFGALGTGRCLRIAPPAAAEDPSILGQSLQRMPIDALKIVPQHLAVLLSGPRPQSLLPKQCLILGGEALEASLLERVRQMAPKLRILNHYGPTETTVGVLVHEIPFDPPGYPWGVPIGLPLANTVAYVVDQSRQPAPTGVAGELLIGGCGLAQGYLKDPAMTAAKFVPNPYCGAGERLYRTGDLVRRLDDGSLLFLGRADQQVKIRGFRVEPAEVAAKLLAHHQVREAFVLARPGSSGSPRLTACLVADRRHAPPTAESLQSYAREALPEYMIPDRFVLLEELPLTANGKVDRRRLALMEMPEAPSQAQASAKASPRTPVERSLSEIWKEVLELDEVGIHDDFYDIGGHSLLATLVVTRAREALGVELPLRTLYENRTIATLSECIDAMLLSQESLGSAFDSQDYEGGEL